jgi:hypothetical protein
MNYPYLNYRDAIQSIPQSGGYANEPTPIDRDIQSLITLI